MRSTVQIKVADEVWIATALLHRNHPDIEDFAVEQIVERARKENIAGAIRPGVYVHAVQHCVANRPPNPGRYCMLFETAKGRRRLWRKGDRIDPKRSGAKQHPERKDIPAGYLGLLDWYLSKYSPGKNATGASDPILSLRGMGKEIWHGETPDRYVQKLREGWE